MWVGSSAFLLLAAKEKFARMDECNAFEKDLESALRLHGVAAGNFKQVFDKANTSYRQFSIDLD